MRRSLLAFDIDRIKDYVFATDMLREIRGASALLTDLNKHMLHLVPNAETDYSYAYGGSGLFLVDTADVPGTIEQVQQEFTARSGGAASITGIALDLPADFDPQTDPIQQHWRLLGARLAAAKARNPPLLSNISHPILRYGDSDGAYYAVTFASDDPGALVSQPAQIKRHVNRQLRGDPTRPPRPDSFVEMAENSDSSMLALIYIDGDGLGRVLDNCTHLADIKRYAEAIHESLDNVVQETLKQHCRAGTYDVLLHGGDDIIIMVAAHDALNVALTITETFPIRTQHALGKTLTISAAIVWANASFPFGVWLATAEDTLSFAKSAGAKRGTPGLLNFQVIASSNNLTFRDYYEQELVTESLTPPVYRLQRTLRPYAPALLRDLMAYRSQLRNVSRSKLEALRRAIYQPRPQQASLDAMRTLVHWRGADTLRALRELVMTFPSKEATRLFPFSRQDEPIPGTDLEDRETYPVYTTALVDLIELWDFIPDERGYNEN
jgi:hypothetical protein